MDNPFAASARDSGPARADSPRLQVLLAHSGVCSRRHAAEWIEAGRVTVNGAVVREPGHHVPPGAAVAVDGFPLPASGHERFRTILLYKPRGLVCSADASEGPTVLECLDGVRERVVPVGRLDKDSEGLLLLSNDGDLVNRLTHPRYGHVKEYLVTVRGELTERMFRELNSPMTLEDDGTRLAPVRVEYEDGDTFSRPPRHRLRMWLVEGRNRQIRRMCEQVGLRVSRLVRVAVNGLRLPRGMRAGQWRDLDPAELRLLDAPVGESPVGSDRRAGRWSDHPQARR